MGRWYELKLEMDSNDTFFVTSPDFPEVSTFGDNQAEALVAGRGAIEEAIAARIADGQPIPHPGPAPQPDGKKMGWWIEIPVLTYLKAALYMIAVDEGITRAELARRMKVHREQVDRLFRIDHQSRMDQMEAAFKAIGVPVKVEVKLPHAA